MDISDFDLNLCDLAVFAPNSVLEQVIGASPAQPLTPNVEWDGPNGDSINGQVDLVFSPPSLVINDQSQITLTLSLNNCTAVIGGQTYDMTGLDVCQISLTAPFSQAPQTNFVLDFTTVQSAPANATSAPPPFPADGVAWAQFCEDFVSFLAQSPSSPLDWQIAFFCGRPCLPQARNMVFPQAGAALPLTSGDGTAYTVFAFTTDGALPAGFAGDFPQGLTFPDDVSTWMVHRSDLVLTSLGQAVSGVNPTAAASLCLVPMDNPITSWPPPPSTWEMTPGSYCPVTINDVATIRQTMQLASGGPPGSHTFNAPWGSTEVSSYFVISIPGSAPSVGPVSFLIEDIYTVSVTASLFNDGTLDSATYALWGSYDAATANDVGGVIFNYLPNASYTPSDPVVGDPEWNETQAACPVLGSFGSWFYDNFLTPLTEQIGRPDIPFLGYPGGSSYVFGNVSMNSQYALVMQLAYNLSATHH